MGRGCRLGSAGAEVGWNQRAEQVTNEGVSGSELDPSSLQLGGRGM